MSKPETSAEMQNDDPHPGYDCGGTCVIHSPLTRPFRTAEIHCQPAAPKCTCASRADGIGAMHGHHDEECPLSQPAATQCDGCYYCGRYGCVPGMPALNCTCAIRNQGTPGIVDPERDFSPAPTSTAAPERIWVDPQSYAICSIHPRSDGVVYVRASSAPRLTPEQARERIRKVMREYYWKGEDGYIEETLVDRITTELLRIDKEATQSETTIENALRELREMFPDSWFALEISERPNYRQYFIRVYGMKRQLRTALTLDEAMRQVRQRKEANRG